MGSIGVPCALFDLVGAFAVLGVLGRHDERACPSRLVEVSVPYAAIAKYATRRMRHVARPVNANFFHVSSLHDERRLKTDSVCELECSMSAAATHGSLLA